MTTKDTSSFQVCRLYRHFKNKLYYVHSLAKHSETGELMVVYQAMYGNREMFVRPYNMFTEEVPLDKENPTGQKYRFEPYDY